MDSVDTVVSLQDTLATLDDRLADIFEHVRTRIVPETELREIDPDGRTFMNLNTPEDYRRALALWLDPRRPLVPPPPSLQPHALRGLTVENRAVVAPGPRVTDFPSSSTSS